MTLVAVGQNFTSNVRQHIDGFAPGFHSPGQFRSLAIQALPFAVVDIEEKPRHADPQGEEELLAFNAQAAFTYVS
jgi:hypothetical protein